jgi:hyperosmotically inducible protein
MPIKFSHAAVVATVLAALLNSPVAFGQKTDKNHRDSFVPGDANEEQLAKKVRHELLMQPHYGVFDDLAFKIDGNVVTLVGSATQPVLKNDAEGAVKRIPGVEQVVDQIDVLPPSPMDDNIRRAEFRAIYGDPALSTRYGFRALPPIHIIVKNGAVTLHGAVANQGDKNLVYLRANAVPGVFSVKNELQVDSAGE